jgi:Uma2 family endonuclease
MNLLVRVAPQLCPGDNLSREEFLRIWNTLPDVKYAELIGGVVYMPSPLSRRHGERNAVVVHWLHHYALHTPGCSAGCDMTWLMEDDAPQPDVALRVLPEYGGQSRNEGNYVAGAPELLAEVCVSSRAYDLHQKLDLYRAAGVREYVAVLVEEAEVRWHRLVAGAYQRAQPDAQGVFRSEQFPGLWLNAPALLQGTDRDVLDALEAGLHSPEHAAFVALLQQRRSSGQPAN